MHKSDFDFHLPPALIAQAPLPERTASRLLCLDGSSGRLEDRHFADLPQLLRPGDLLVFNNTRVLPARLFGAKASGGRIELLLERMLGGRCVRVQCRASKPPRIGQLLHLEGDVTARVLARAGEFYDIEFEGQEPLFALLERVGHIPLPPYITRADARDDRERYQTVYADQPGAVAAPTAGLHFDAELLSRLSARGVEQVFVTLHVGAGTFQPLRVDDLKEHHMHSEWFEVEAEAAARINAARQAGRRVIAVGTTVVRTLESVATNGGVQAASGETDIFIYPGYRFQVVDALITNFHLPQSTLIMLVCAFGGTAAVLHAYRHAIEQRYRFFSYGDAMFVTLAQ